MVDSSKDGTTLTVSDEGRIALGAEQEGKGDGCVRVQDRGQAAGGLAWGDMSTRTCNTVKSAGRRLACSWLAICRLAGLRLANQGEDWRLPSLGADQRLAKSAMQVFSMVLSMLDAS